MLFQKEKEICSWHSMCRKQKNKDELKKTEIDRKTEKICTGRKRSLWNIVRPFPPTNGGLHIHNLSEKVSLCAPNKIWKKASLAIETALVLPLFFLGLVTMVLGTMVILCTGFTVGGETVDGLSAAGLSSTGFSGFGASRIGFS